MKRTGLAVAVTTVCAFALGLTPLAACSRSGGAGDAGADAALDAGLDGDADDGEAEAEPPWYTSADASAKCGYKPPGDGAVSLPDCPLQAWMRRHSRLAITIADVDDLTATFEAIARLAPADEGYENWVEISNDGAHAARRGDVDGARAACRGCHDTYRIKYHAYIRARPLNDPFLLETDATVRDAAHDTHD